MFERVLIANRGEIACRVIRTCRRLGIHTVAVYSEADANAQHVRLADEAYPIGGPRPADSYLRGDAIIEVAKRPARRRSIPATASCPRTPTSPMPSTTPASCSSDPTAESMRTMGSKAGAKELMARRGVPVVPGYTGADQDAALLAREAAAHRLSADDQGRARRRRQGHAHRAQRGGIPAELDSCQREAANAFGRDRVLLERYIETSAPHRDSRCSATRTATSSTSTSASARRSAATRKCWRKRPRRSSRPSCARDGRRRGRGGDARSIMSTPARSNSSSTPAATSISWRSTRACRSSIR